MAQVPAGSVSASGKKWLWIVGLVVVLLVVGFVVSRGSGGSTASAPAPTTSVSTEAARPGLETAPSAPAARPPVVHIVVYEVTGSGSGTVTYSTDGAGGTGVATDVPLPWSTTVELPVEAGTQSVSVVADGGASELGARITVDGEVVKEGGSSPAYNSVSLTANVGPQA
ncbi:MmpS family transport accessory protein [Umezawaea sp. Da 62-37]|uniref:MmpS family transport accessory protein n=1 Tax=Umezawaea sp. Da 62-37 TaxID=3075927 RepID=UPI0028F72A24|nr:MmpS family transport accessory protein [Umezawaea sp. Da 62-37]WNV84451.1 MmpS family transport accessory protein [Umezawaea sp. Da 62-37]